jgi:hypothetical protein
LSYNSNFQRALIDRSLLLIQEYSGPYDATLLLNCLLGLVLVPHAQCFVTMPLDPLDEFPKKWGIPLAAILKQGDYRTDRKRNPEKLAYYCFRFFVNDLRDAIAHCFFRPIPENGEVTAFQFWNDHHNFSAEIRINDLRVFGERLAEQLKTM